MAEPAAACAGKGACVAPSELGSIWGNKWEAGSKKPKEEGPCPALEPMAAGCCKGKQKINPLGPIEHRNGEDTMMEGAPELHTVQSLKDCSEESWLVPVEFIHSVHLHLLHTTVEGRRPGWMDLQPCQQCERFLEAGWSCSLAGSCLQGSRAATVLLETHGDDSLGWGISRRQSQSWKVQTLSPCHVQPGH